MEKRDNKAKEKTKEEIEELRSKVYEKLVELSGSLAQLSFQRILNKSPELASQQQELKQLYEKYKVKYDKLLTMKE